MRFQSSGVSDRSRRTQRSCSDSSSVNETSTGVVLRVGQFGPAIFRVGLDGRFVFGKSQLEAHVGIQMAVGHVMHDLTHRPSAGTVGRVELRARTVLLWQRAGLPGSERCHRGSSVSGPQ